MSSHVARSNVTTDAKVAPRKPGRSNAVKAALARTPGKGNPKKFIAFLDTLPPGTMTAAEIDREIDEVRGGWGR
jgi:hypothetical protein